MKYPALAGSLMLALLLGRLDAQTPPPGLTNDIPASAFFHFSDFFSPVVAPDGKNVAFIARHNGHSRLFKLELVTARSTGCSTPAMAKSTAFGGLAVGVS